MKNAISTGIFAAVVFVGLGFFWEGGDTLGAWLPQRLGFGLAFGLAVGIFSGLAASWKKTR